MIGIVTLVVSSLALGEPDVERTPVQLGVCQALQGVEGCATHSGWEIEKSASTSLLVNPDHAPVDYRIRVIEGPTRYTLALASTLTLTGLVPEGTRVLGLAAGLQKGGEDGFTTVASGATGDLGSLCDCPNVGGGELAIEALVSGQALGDEVLIEHLALGEHIVVGVDVRYDLSAGVVQPGDRLRLQVCLSFEPASPREGEIAGVCRDEGGSVRSVRACSAVDLGATVPAVGSVTAHDVLGAVPAWLSVSGLTPGLPVALEVTPSGVPGTVHDFTLRAAFACASDLSCEGGVCTATIDNVATLGEEQASASLVVTCSPDLCEAGCDDGDPCTVDRCDPSCGCLHERIDTPACHCACPDDQEAEEDDGHNGTDYPGWDSDGDGLPDLAEDPDRDGLDAHETSALSADTDGDGLCDGAIVVPPCVGVEDRDGDASRLDWGRDEPSPLDPDSDDDGLCDGEWMGGDCVGGELAQGTDPLDTDSDDDGLCDGPGGGAWDASGCQRSEVGDDGRHQTHETDPADPDSDGGGVPDGVEVLDQGTDPLDPCDGDPPSCSDDDENATPQGPDTWNAEHAGVPPASGDTISPELIVEGGCGGGPSPLMPLLLLLPALRRRAPTRT